MSLSEKFKVVVCPADASKNSKEGACRALQTQFGRVTSHTELGVNWVGPPSVGQSEPCERLLACCCVGFPKQTNPDTLHAASPMCA